MVPRLRDQLVWDEQVVLVAESCAGPLALEFACEQPEQVRAIVLVNSFVTNPLSPWLDWVAKWWLKPWACKLPSSKFIRKYLLGPEAPEVLVDALSQALGSVNPKVLASRVEEMMRVDARPALARCRAPILNLVGTQDLLVGERGWSGITGVHPYLTTETIDGPHLLLQTHSRETATAIDEFLTALPRCAHAA
jgi:pimeloyl-ACP methyl ester carboxylesterase